MTMHKWLLLEVSRIRESFSSWLFFWLSTITFIFYYFLITSGENAVKLTKELYLAHTNIFLVYGSIVLFVIGGIFIFIVKPSTQLNRQEIHKQPSWVFYSYWGFINAFLLWSAVSLASMGRESWWFGLCISLAIILVK